MTLSQDLWNANLDLAHACLDHPFVRGIASGELPRERFAYYVGQDAFFLQAFARAYSLAAVKAADWESFRTLHSMVDGVLEELRMHEGYAKSWGVRMRNVEPGAATRRYTDFLLATAWSADTGLTTVAMLPCMRLYSFIGQELAREDIPEHDYSNWVRTYADPSIADLVTQLEQLAERHAVASPQVMATYRYAMICERDFFQAAWDFRA